jgi:hypothetical protein
VGAQNWPIRTKPLWFLAVFVDQAHVQWHCAAERQVYILLNPQNALSAGRPNGHEVAANFIS